MNKTLVIVESPTKARTISRFLGKDFFVESSMGHIRDLPTSKLGVDVENNFEPHYVISRKVLPQVKKLRELAKKANTIILATDEDREGEAIAWHLTHALKLSEEKNADKNVERIVFHEITERAITEALKHPRDIDIRIVNAQQARRILDRIVGYTLSPFLWKKVAKGLSAGRVQSVAVRLIVEREKEISEFIPEEYWTITAHFTTKPPLIARLYKIGSEVVPKLGIKTKENSDAIVKNLSGATYHISSIEKKATVRKPHPPFTTSTLQQTASSRFGYSAKQTMRIAQQLYEGINVGNGAVGLITYMRTDSLALSEDSLIGAKEFITKTFGKRYTISTPRRFKTKSKGAQEAHEAIRPTDSTRTPESLRNKLEPQQFKLYELIWQRFLATQMPEAIFDATTVDIIANKYMFRANGSMLTFDGFLAVYPMKTEDTLLPVLSKDTALTLQALVPEQHATEPPPRYSEATLIKALEKHGIGRPSTYAPTLSTIQDRGYVERNEAKRLAPTEMGIMVNTLLVEHFPQIVDIEFTAQMENNLDNIADGTTEWVTLIRNFYIPFSQLLEKKYETVEKKTVDEETDEICEKCGKPMIIKHGRFGRFMACSGFPDCRNTKRLPEHTLGIKCPLCKEGDLFPRRTKSKRMFYGCTQYPDCDFALWDKPIGKHCSNCDALMIEKGKRIICSNKECSSHKKS